MRVERFRGSMLGLAVGDALGSPVKGLKDGHVRQLYGEVKDYVDPSIAWKKKPHRWMRPGLYGDGAQLSLALADSLLKCRGFDAGHLVRMLKALAGADTGRKLGAIRGAGPNFRKVMFALMEGETPEKAAAPSAGVGAASRAAPAGLFHFDDEEARIRAAVGQGAITHLDPRALVMAAAVAHAAARSVTGEWDGQRPRAMMEDLIEASQKAEKLVRLEYYHLIPVSLTDRIGMTKDALSMFPRLLDLPDKSMVFRQIVAESNRQFPEHKITEPGQGFVMAAGLSCLFVALTAADFEDGLKKTIGLGKATDSMAAIVGAILGARLGEEEIPSRWKKGLINGEQAALRGEALFHRGGDGLPLQDLVKMEAKLTRDEEILRAEFVRKMEEKGLAGTAAKKPSSKKKAPEPVAFDVDAVMAAPSAKPRRDKSRKPKREKAPWKR